MSAHNTPNPQNEQMYQMGMGVGGRPQMTDSCDCITDMSGTRYSNNDAVFQDQPQYSPRAAAARQMFSPNDIYCDSTCDSRPQYNSQLAQFEQYGRQQPNQQTNQTVQAAGRMQQNNSFGGGAIRPQQQAQCCRPVDRVPQSNYFEPCVEGQGQGQGQGQGRGNAQGQGQGQGQEGQLRAQQFVQQLRMNARARSPQYDLNSAGSSQASRLPRSPNCDSDCMGATQQQQQSRRPMSPTQQQYRPGGFNQCGRPGDQPGDNGPYPGMEQQFVLPSQLKCMQAQGLLRTPSAAGPPQPSVRLQPAYGCQRGAADLCSEMDKYMSKNIPQANIMGLQRSQQMVEMNVDDTAREYYLKPGDCRQPKTREGGVTSLGCDAADAYYLGKDQTPYSDSSYVAPMPQKSERGAFQSLEIDIAYPQSGAGAAGVCPGPETCTGGVIGGPGWMFEPMHHSTQQAAYQMSPQSSYDVCRPRRNQAQMAQGQSSAGTSRQAGSSRQQPCPCAPTQEEESLPSAPISMPKQSALSSRRQFGPPRQAMGSPRQQVSSPSSTDCPSDCCQQPRRDKQGSERQGQNPLAGSSQRSRSCGPSQTHTFKSRSMRLNQNSTPEEKFVARMQELQHDSLVRDDYCPGVIQDTIDGNDNFNDYAYDLVYAGRPPPRPAPVDPITLLEAFHLRIEHERKELDKYYQNSDRRLSNRDIDEYFYKLPKTELNEALNVFLKIEKFNEYLDTLNERAFSADVNKADTKFPGANILLSTYVATTQPIQSNGGEDPIDEGNEAKSSKGGKSSKNTKEDNADGGKGSKGSKRASASAEPNQDYYYGKDKDM